MKKWAKALIIFHMALGFWAVLPVVVGWLALRRIDNAKNKNDLIGMGVATMICCSILGGVFMMLISYDELKNNDPVLFKDTLEQMKTISRIFIIIGMVFGFFLVIPIIVGFFGLKKINEAEGKKDLFKTGIWVLILCSFVGGLFMLCMPYSEIGYSKQDKNEKIANENIIDFSKVFIAVGMICGAVFILPLIVGLTALHKLDEARNKDDLVCTGVAAILFCGFFGGLFMLLISSEEFGKDKEDSGFYFNKTSNTTDNDEKNVVKEKKSSSFYYNKQANTTDKDEKKVKTVTHNIKGEEAWVCPRCTITNYGDKCKNCGVPRITPRTKNNMTIKRINGVQK